MTGDVLSTGNLTVDQKKKKKTSIINLTLMLK